MKPDDFRFEVNPKKPTLGITIKKNVDVVPSDVDELILKMVYGTSKKHPGDENSLSQKLLKFDEEGNEFIGIWAPDNPFTRALGFKNLFPNISKYFKLPELKPVPLHIAMAFEAYKAKDILALNKEFPEQVLRYGFFTSDKPNSALLIEKTFEKFELRPTPTTYEEKIVIQLAKTNQDCFERFNDLGPSYRSANVEVGEEDCSYFFPADYDEPLKLPTSAKKKLKKKKGKMVAQDTLVEESAKIEDGAEEAIVGEGAEQADVKKEEVKAEGEDDEENEEDADTEEEEEDEEEEVGDFDNDKETAIGADKATSPISEEI